jgi:hypothetical protein
MCYFFAKFPHTYTIAISYFVFGFLMIAKDERVCSKALLMQICFANFDKHFQSR